MNHYWISKYLIRAKYIRAYFSRINKNIKSFNGCHYPCTWSSAISPFFMGIWRTWKDNEFYERVSRCSLACCLIFDQVEVQADLPNGLLNDIANFCLNFQKRIYELTDVLSSNSIWESPTDWNWCFANGCRIKLWCNWRFYYVRLVLLGDLRVASPYEIYDELKFQIPIGTHGELLW